MVNSPVPVHRRKYSGEYKNNNREILSVPEKYAEDHRRLNSLASNLKMIHKTEFSKVFSANNRLTGGEIILKEIPKKYLKRNAAFIEPPPRPDF